MTLFMYYLIYISLNLIHCYFLIMVTLFYEENWHLVFFFSNCFFFLIILVFLNVLENIPLFVSALKEYLYCGRSIPKCVVEILKSIGVVMHLWEEFILLRQIFKNNRTIQVFFLQSIFMLLTKIFT